MKPLREWMSQKQQQQQKTPHAFCFRDSPSPPPLLQDLLIKKGFLIPISL
jgi:hypothetical protein